ncbi:MAG TPA: hypothetical protein VKA53_06525, partial [Thermoanaerobaculia bacterium]|nr:hypothetical protein [Thermoanaerobaculia bacterium]
MEPRLRPAIGWILILLGLPSLAPAAPLQEAEEPAIEHLQVSLWPEYDRPDVLVMLDGEIGSEAGLPATLSLPIPAGVTPHAVAWRDASGLKVANYTLSTRNSRELVRMTLPQRGFHLEY